MASKIQNNLMDDHFIEDKLENMEDDSIDKETELEDLEGKLMML